MSEEKREQLREIKDYVEHQIGVASTELKYGLPLVNDRNYARFWEGKVYGIKFALEKLEKINDLLKKMGDVWSE